MTTDSHRDDLEPYAERYRGMVGDWHRQLKTSSTAELEDLFTAARRLTTTNCGWWEYNAAQQLMDVISTVVVLRRDASHEFRRGLDWHRTESPTAPQRMEIED